MEKLSSLRSRSGGSSFGEDGLGSLGFIVVTGELDCRDADRDGQPTGP